MGDNFSSAVDKYKQQKTTILAYELSEARKPIPHLFNIMLVKVSRDCHCSTHLSTHNSEASEIGMLKLVERGYCTFKIFLR